MTKKSKVTGASKGGVGKRLSAMPSSSEVLQSSTSAMLESSANQPSQIGFQPTEALKEMDEVTANVKILMAFASKLTPNGLVSWKHIELGDGQAGYALFFPDTKWKAGKEGLSVRSVVNEK